METDKQLTITREDSEGGHLLVVTGELDIATAPGLEATVSSLCQAGARRIAIDFSELTFIDSAGVRAILVATDLCADNRSGLELVRSRHLAARRVFELSGLSDQILPWREEQ